MADNPSVIFMESSPNIGGQELQLLQQMEQLNSLGWETHLFCKQTSRIFDEAKIRGLSVESFSFRNALHVPSIWKISCRLRQIKPIAVILHSGHDAIVGAISTRLSYVFSRFRPKIVRMRTYQPGIPGSFPYNYLFDETYTPSKYLRKKILENSRIKPERIKVLYPGIDFSKLENSHEKIPEHILEWLKNHPGPIILQGAMLRGEKGHQIILEALSKIVKFYPTIRYLIAGEGSERETIEKKIHELNLENNVYLVGMVSSISSLLKLSDIAILPSLYEPLGMFQIESQYLMVPTLASQTGGVVETVMDHKTGLLVKAGDRQAWAEAILWALDHLPEMQAWAKHGKEVVLQKFSMEANTKQLLEILKR